MCVTYGETFLSDTKSYDSLYYEFMRATTDFMKLSEYGNVKTKTKTPHVKINSLKNLVNRSVRPRGGDRSPSLTLNGFYNIKLICNHFKPALDQWQEDNNVKFPTPEQVMGK